MMNKQACKMGWRRRTLVRDPGKFPPSPPPAPAPVFTTRHKMPLDDVDFQHMGQK